MHAFYFQIGEFAKICGVKKATLIHYAKSGILSPDHVGENGYYYYHPSQIFDFEAIAVLRSMSVPLAAIKEYLEDRNIENCQNVLQKSLQTLKEEKRRLEYVETIVENTLCEIETAKSIVKDKIELINIEQEDRFYVYKMPFRDENYVYQMSNVHEMVDYCKESLSNRSVNVVEVVLHEDIMNGSFKKTYGGFRASEYAEISPEHLYCRPAGTYLALCSRSGGNKIVEVYRKLKKHADENGYTIIGNAYEEDVLNYIVEHDREDYLVRCLIQVEQQK